MLGLNTRQSLSKNRRTNLIKRNLQNSPNEASIINKNTYVKSMESNMSSPFKLPSLCLKHKIQSGVLRKYADESPESVQSECDRRRLWV